MNDFGLFEEFIDDFLSVNLWLLSSTIWLKCRRCSREWWGEGRRKGGAVENAGVVLAEGYRWTWWTKCTKRWWNKWWRTSMQPKEMSKKTSNSSLNKNCSSSNSANKMSPKRKNHLRRNFWSAISMLKEWRKIKSSFILQSITTNNLSNGRRQKVRRRKSLRKSSRQHYDLINFA